MTNLNKTALVLLTLAFLALAIEPLGSAISAYRAARTLAEFTSQVPGSTVILCSRPSLTAPQARQVLAEILPRLPSPALQAAADCALGDRAAASNLYARLAATGDTWAALQVVILSQGQIIPNGLPENVSRRELNAAQSIGSLADISIDWRPLIRQVIQRQPSEDSAWEIWLAEGKWLEQQKQVPDAVAWYQEGLDRQKALGVMAYRSSLALRAGIIAQIRLKPPDLHQAMAFYDQALQVQRFSGAAEKISLYNYRGQALFALRAEVGPAPALEEFKQTLTLDETNFTATLWMGIVYYSAYNDFPQALIWFQRAAGLKENDQTPYYYLGITYTKLAQFNAAAQAFDRALQINPKWDAVRKLRQALP